MKDTAVTAAPALPALSRHTASLALFAMSGMLAPEKREEIIGNAEIRAERLSPAEVVAVERADAERFGALEVGLVHVGDDEFCALSRQELAKIPTHIADALHSDGATLHRAPEQSFDRNEDAERRHR